MIPLVNDAQPATRLSRLYRSGADLIAIALGLRLIMAWLMPCISKDGALYCWFARDLGHDFLGTLASGQYQQHPLFPAAILAVQRCLVWFGCADRPLTWQLAGQGVSFVSGSLLVVACGALAAGLLARLDPVRDRDTARRWVLGLAAVLPLGVWLSADVMSDPLHALLYVGSLLMLRRRPTSLSALLAGLLAGLAFLVRPEAVAIPLAVAVAAAAEWWRRVDRHAPARACVVLVGFALVAAPYAIAIGKLSPKQDKQTVQQFVHAGAACEDIARAGLTRTESTWYESIGLMVYHTGRAGRVVVPLLGVLGLWQMRRRLAGPGVNVVVGCLSIHATLVALLQWRAGYLDPRHTLISVFLLLPFAAMFAESAWSWLRARRPGAEWLFLAACIGPLAAYALRVPNAGDAFVARTADWLASNVPEARGRVLLGGSSQRRIAFYADTQFVPWNEYEPDEAARFRDVHGYIVHADAEHGPHFFALQTAATEEGRQDARLLEQLLADPQSSAHLRLLHEERSDHGAAQHLYRVE